MKNARLLHYSHCVSDIEVSRRFYTEVLGFEIVAEFAFDDADTARVMGVPDARFTVAWKQLTDPKGFAAPYGLTTAEQRHPGFAIHYDRH